MIQVVRAIIAFLAVGALQAVWLGLMAVVAAFVTAISFAWAGVERFWGWLRWTR